MRTVLKLKFKWKNLLKIMILTACFSVVVHDLYMLTIYSWINHVSTTWTAFGGLTFLFACFLADYIFDDLFLVKNFQKK